MDRHVPPTQPRPLEPPRRPLPTAVKVFLGILGIVIIIIVVTFLVLRSQPERNEPATPTTEEEAGPASLLVSYDGGDTWNEVESSKGFRLRTIEFKNGDSNTLYVGTEGKGLWVYDDVRKSMEEVKDPDNNLKNTANIFDIEQSLDGEALYVGAFQEGRGRVVRLVESGSREIYIMPLEGFGVFGVFVDPLDARHINFAAGDGSFFESRDGGTTNSWEVIARFREGTVKFESSETAPTRMWAIGNQNGLYTTSTGGRSWFARPSISVDSNGISKINDMRYHTPRGALMLATDYGLIESYDDGVTWESFQTPIVPKAAPISAVAVHPRRSETFWMTSGNQMYRTQDGGITWKQIILPTPLQISMLRVDSQNPLIMYAGLTQ